MIGWFLLITVVTGIAMYFTDRLLKRSVPQTTVEDTLPVVPVVSPPEITVDQPNSIPMKQFPQMITKWSEAIARWEGAEPSSNNPGNLKYSSLTASWGATKGRAAADDGFFCQFETLQEGQDALCNFLMLGADDELLDFHTPFARTLQGFTVIYAGNPPQGYINGISEYLGVPVDTQISTFLT